MNAVIDKFNAGSAPAVKSGFKIDPHDRITISGKAYRMSRHVGDNVELVPADEDGLVEQFPMSTLGRLSAMGRVQHEVGYYLPDDLKMSAGIADAHFRVSDLTEKQRMRFLARYAQVMAVEELVEAGELQNNTGDIEKSKSRIEELARPYLQQAAAEHALINHDLEFRSDQTLKTSSRKSKGGKTVVTIDLFHSDTIRKLVANYRKHGVAALVDSLAKSGNRTRSFRPEELKLMMKLIQGSYLTTERKSKKATVQDVKRGFFQKNKQLEKEGLKPLRVPGRDAIIATIGKLDVLKVLIARWGRERAINMLRPVNKGIEVSRPGERVEIDEWRIDLISIIHSAGLAEAFGATFMRSLGLDNEKARWWLVVAIDCRTRIILGMKLTRNPTTSAARECLRMVMSDKGQWADSVGALTPWSQAVVPELLVSDNGPAFKSELFSSTCMDLGMSVLRTIAGIPGMRGMVERLFLTASLDLMPRLFGRTFSNPRERGDYPAKERACLDTSDLAFALVRWVVDIYHNSPHAGLGGRTPLEQWEADIDDGNYPLRALPDTRSKRLAFGMRLTRKVSRSGVVVMGIHYHSRELAAWFMRPGNKRVDVRWDAEDLGAIEVFLEGKWREISAVHERFVGVSLHVWLKSRRALRARSASRKLWDEETVFRAIDEIEALAAHKKAVYGLLDTSISEKELRRIERSLFSSFKISNDPKLLADGSEPGREIAPREPNEDLPLSSPKERRPPRATPKTPMKSPPAADATASGAQLANEHKPIAKQSKTPLTTQNIWIPVKKEQK